MAKKIKPWVAEAIMDSLDSGAVSETRLKLQWGKDFNRLMKKIGRLRREKAEWDSGRAVITIYGRIVRSADRAVLFSESDAAGNERTTGESWWPLSQVRVFERGYGPMDSLAAPRWLVEKNYK